MLQPVEAAGAAAAFFEAFFLEAFFLGAALRFFAFFTFGAAGAAAATAFFAFFFAAILFTSTKLPRTHLALRPLACQTARDL